MISTKILTIDQIIASENTYIKKNSFSKLINKASSQIVKYIKENIKKKKILFLCGPGNNGLDGELTYTKLKSKKNKIIKIDKKCTININELKKRISEVDVIFDCIFGTGLNKKLNKKFISIINLVNHSKKKIISVDVPSGMNGDTGQIMDITVKPDVTLCMEFLKTGYFLLPGKKFLGKIVRLKLGLKSSKNRQPKINLISKSCFKNKMPLFGLEINKYDKGHVLVVGGEMPGASRLVALSSRKSGAGLSTLAIDRKHVNLYLESEPGTILKIFDYSDLKSKDVLVLGPGLGKKFSKMKIIKILELFDKPIIMDADAISIFEDKKKEFINFVKKKNNILLTPHLGEFKRIFNYSSNSKIINCINASNIIENSILLKGHDSVISFYNQDVWINNINNNNLATAGSGDLLCGIIAGLIAQKMDFKSAILAGVWIQNKISCSQNEVIVEDFLKKIPLAIKSLKNIN